MSYPSVKVYNSTNETCSVKVKYAACSTDETDIFPMSDWSNDRGLCLITEVSAIVRLPDGKSQDAKSYTSSGTSYSEFAIIKQGDNYTVTRVIT